jgi:sugar phosphate isomerase/epimerase
MPTIALATGSLHTYGLARVFGLAAQAGFDAVEIMADHRWDSRQPAYLCRLSQATSLPVAAIHSPFVSIDTPGWPHDPIGRLRESAALAREVGASVVVAHLPLRIRVSKIEFLGSGKGPLLLPIPMGGERDYLDFLLADLCQFEEEQGLRVGIENMPARHFLGRIANIHYLNDPEALSQLPHLTFDTTHIGTWGLDLLEVYGRLKERIIHVHLSDFDGREHLLPGDGHLPLAEFLKQLVQDGFEDTITLEVGPEVLEAEDEGRVLAHLRQARRFLREHTGR